MTILTGILLFLHVVVSALLITVILLQASKGGGLAGTFGGQTTTTLFGPRGTASALASVTQYLATAFLVLSLALSLMAGAGQKTESVTQKVLQSTPASQLPPVEALDYGKSSAPAGGAESQSEPAPETPTTK